MWFDNPIGRRVAPPPTSLWLALASSLRQLLGSCLWPLLAHCFKDNAVWSMNSGCLVPNRNSGKFCYQIVDRCQLLWFGGFKMADDVLPYELGDIFVFDASVCFSFHPFIEVICGDEQEFFSGRLRLVGVLLCPCPTARRARGLKLVSTSPTTHVVWGHAFDICHIF